MKVFIDSIFQLDPQYQEVLVGNFTGPNFLVVRPTKQNVKGVIHENVYVLEPSSYYEIKLKSNVPHEFDRFKPSTELRRSGLIVSDIDTESMSIFVYNCSHNTIFIESDCVLGKIE